MEVRDYNTREVCAARAARGDGTLTIRRVARVRFLVSLYEFYEAFVSSRRRVNENQNINFNNCSINFCRERGMLLV